MSAEQAEELLVLESILDSTELTQLGEDEIAIRVEPEMDTPGHGDFAVSLRVTYTSEYPAEVPRLKVEAIEGDLEESDLEELEAGVRTEAEASLGMAMVYTLTMTLKEALTALLARKAEEEANAEAAVAQAKFEAEEARTRGTPVTVDSFNAWRIRFTAEMKQLKLKEEEDRLKSLPPKERDEAKRMATKLTGKAMFERNRNLDNVDEANADGTDIDLSKYERTAEQEESDEEGSLVLSDSD